MSNIYLVLITTRKLECIERLRLSGTAFNEALLSLFLGDLMKAPMSMSSMSLAELLWSSMSLAELRHCAIVSYCAIVLLWSVYSMSLAELLWSSMSLAELLWSVNLSYCATVSMSLTELLCYCAIVLSYCAIVLLSSVYFSC
ncbi:hypothetical protein DPMN_183608 [Dreissena polymorpha]|uniref:Uncharacterized protein n=1 Tax=Dreissena polymorpha TaxID=45954 RepID=A0A9D4DGA8_DREPO|nr:hypothetical protein DPMN_183608 [Dreissena polymorpha]